MAPTSTASGSSGSRLLLAIVSSSVEARSKCSARLRERERRAGPEQCRCHSRIAGLARCRRVSDGRNRRDGWYVQSEMGLRRSKLFWVAVVGAVAGTWHWCGSSDEPMEAELHVKLAPGASFTSVPALDHASVLDEGRLFTRSESALAKDREDCPSCPDLSTWRRVQIKGSRKAIEKAIATLNAREDVVTAFEAPKAELAVVRDNQGEGSEDSCPIKTPSYRGNQGYLDKAPGGIDAPAAWKV